MRKEVAIIGCFALLLGLCLFLCWARVTPMKRIEKIGDATNLCNVIEFVCPRGDFFDLELALARGEDVYHINGRIQMEIGGRIIRDAEIYTNKLAHRTKRLGSELHDLYILSGGTNRVSDFDKIVRMYPGASVKVTINFYEVPPSNSSFWLRYSQSGIEDILDTLRIPAGEVDQRDFPKENGSSNSVPRPS